MANKQLACPVCGSTHLRSDEAATIGYPVRLFRTADGRVDVKYTGDSYETFDEGTVYSGEIWCLNCGANPEEVDLIEVDAEPQSPYVRGGVL